jgi:4-carboxymuconolactone decarboxylase
VGQDGQSVEFVFEIKSETFAFGRTGRRQRRGADFGLEFDIQAKPSKTMLQSENSDRKAGDDVANATRSVSRFGHIPGPLDDPILADMFKRIRESRGHILNIHRVVGLAPKMLRAQASYARALRDESSLPRDLQELLILRIAQVNDSAYEQSVHRPIALRCGVPTAKIDALPSWTTSSVFEPQERAALAFVDQGARSGEVEDAVFQALARTFSPQEVIELTALVAWYVGNSRFVRALKIASETAPD